ncbi:unnamed protein product [Tenebrio molitor]|nr:unnamed protein product [Tenebrio molitor]
MHVKMTRIESRVTVPKDTRKRGNIVSVYLIFHRIVQLFQNDLNILKILAHF